MGIFVHGRTWWFEFRRRTPMLRVVKSTGVAVGTKDAKKKAKAVFDAFKMGVEVRPKRSAMESVLEAIYDECPNARKNGIPVSSIWAIYEDWVKGKRKEVSLTTWRSSKSECERVVDWLTKNRCDDVGDVSVIVARKYVDFLYHDPGRKESPRTTKTVRNIVRSIGHIWNTIAQMHPGVHNPWVAACPDSDGTSVRHASFTREELPRIMEAARDVGHGWYLASMIALHTGMRYGNVATLEVGDIDFERWIITGVHRKTAKSSGAEIFIPVAEPLKVLLEPFKAKEGFILPEHGIKYTAGSKPQPMDVPFSEVLKRVGLKGPEYGFHSFRHTANTLMAEAGVPSEVRQILCGWTNDAMARHYDHSQRLGELAAAVAKIGGNAA